jgi:hypothetical protein
MFGSPGKCEWCSNYSESRDLEYIKVNDKYYDVNFCSSKCRYEYKNSRGIEYVPFSDWDIASRSSAEDSRIMRERLIKSGAKDQINIMLGNYPKRFKLGFKTEAIILLVGFILVVYYLWQQIS